MVVDFDIVVQRVVAANRLYNYASEVAVHQKNRKRWAAVLKKTGVTYYTVEGRQILSDAYHPLILPGGCSYSWKCVESGQCLLIEFDAPVRGRLPISFEVTDNTFFVREFEAIQRILASGGPSAQLEAKHRLYGVLLQLTKTADYIPKEKKQLLGPAVQYIQSRYHDPDITNDFLAGLCGISTVYFRKAFEKAYGVPPIRYLHHYRIQKAKDLLLSDYGTITQVAESVGYRSVYHFSKMFKLYTEISPTVYAKNKKE